MWRRKEDAGILCCSPSSRVFHGLGVQVVFPMWHKSMYLLPQQQGQPEPGWLWVCACCDRLSDQGSFFAGGMALGNTERYTPITTPRPPCSKASLTIMSACVWQHLRGWMTALNLCASVAHCQVDVAHLYLVAALSGVEHQRRTINWKPPTPPLPWQE